MILYRTTQMFCVCVSVCSFSFFSEIQIYDLVFSLSFVISDHRGCFSLSLFYKILSHYSLTLVFSLLSSSAWLLQFICFVFLSFWLHDMLCCYCYICGLTSLLEALRFQRTSLPCTPRLFSLPVQLIYAQNHPESFYCLFFTSYVPIPPPLGLLLFGPPFCRTSWVRHSALWVR